MASLFLIAYVQRVVMLAGGHSSWFLHTGVVGADLCSCSFFGPAFVARCSGGVHWYSSTVLDSPLIRINCIVDFCIHVACTVEASVWHFVACLGVGWLVNGLRSTTLCLGNCWDAPQSHPVVLIFSPYVLIVSVCILHWWVGVL